MTLNSLPNAVFFDWDGTLVNTIPLLRRAHNHVRVSYGHEEWTEAEFRENLRHSSRDIYPKIYGDNFEEAFDRLYAYFEKNHLKEIEFLPHAKELVSYIHEQNIPMGVVSNKKHDYLLLEIEAMGLSDMLPYAFGSGSFDVDKPSGKPILWALEAAGVPHHPDHVWYVGDSDTDMMAANDANLAAILFAESPRKEQLENEFSPFLSLNGCNDLHELLIKCNQSSSYA